MWICFPQDISEGKDQNAKKQSAAHLGECRGVLPRRDVLLHGGAAPQNYFYKIVPNRLNIDLKNLASLSNKTKMRKLTKEHVLT